MTVSLSPFAGAGWQFLDVNGDPLENGFVHTYAVGSTTPLAAYTTSAGNQDNTNPIQLNAAGRPTYLGSEVEIWLTSTSVYKFVVTDANGANARTFDNIPGIASAADLVAYEAQLATSAGAGLIGFSQSATYPADTLGAHDQGIVYPGDAPFNVKGDGTTNDSVAMLAFFNHCIANGRGHIPGGRYPINAGVLAFDTGFTDKAWPVITTDGPEAVTFLFADNVDLPMITLTNGTATGPAGRYWLGGELGGFTVEDSVPVGGGGTNRHALSLTGVWGTQFGWIRANDTAGDAINLPQKLYGGTNPDPYAVTYCNFLGAEANRVTGRAFTNANGPGLNFCRVGAIRAVETTLGGLYGLGASCTFEQLSIGGNTGWAVYDGDEGTVDRAYIADLEIDNSQYGVRLNQATFVTIERCRLISRFQTSPNATALYWPLTCFELGASASPTLREVAIDVIFRIETGGVLADLGKFFDFNNGAGGNSLYIDCVVLDEAGIGIPDASMFSVFNGNAYVRIVRDSREIINTLLQPNSGASYTGSLAVLNAGFGTAATILAFNNERYDPQGVYDATTYGWTAPKYGIAHVNFVLPLTVAVGTRIRMAIWVVRGGVGSVVARRDHFSVNAACQHYELSQWLPLPLQAGDIVYAMADQNTAGSVNVTPQSVTDGEALFQMTQS